MPAIHFAALFGILLAVCCYQGISLKRENAAAEKNNNIKKNIQVLSALLFPAALLLRLAAAARWTGFDTDLSCFAAWAERMYELGPSGFYSPEVFTDYPPGYMYVLWLLGGLRRALRLPCYSTSHLALLKLPSILCDLASGWLLYGEASRRFTRRGTLLLCAAYLFHPVIILNSAVWGQVDSVFTLTLLLMCLALVRGRLTPACAAFCAGVLLKPQMLIFSPILLAGMTDQLFHENFSWRRLGKNLAGALLSLTGMVCLCIPFGLENVWRQYFSTVESYPYAAVNACNFWGLLGLNWVSQENTFLGIPFRHYGYFFILLTVAVVFAVSLRHRRLREKYPFLAAILILTLFTFSVRMHERYLYPGLLLLLLSFVLRPVKGVWLCYGCFSALHFYNTAFALFLYDPHDFDRKSPLLLAVSAGMLAAVFLLYRLAVPQYFSGDAAFGGSSGDTNSGNPAFRSSSGNYASGRALTAGAKPCFFVPRPSRESLPLRKADLLCMVLITLVYSCFALYDLGDAAAPESSYDMTQDSSVTLYFENSGPDGQVCALAYYIAPEHNRNFILETSDARDGQWTAPRTITLDNVFTWQKISLDSPCARLRLTLTDSSASLMELVFLNRDGQALAPSNASDYPSLFDEQELYPARQSFRNSMYFDEIYHGRTAYEFLHGLTAYESTHPPLGKSFISCGIALFGMNPFGWRIVGTLFGILMVPVLYLFGKRITANTPAAALACVLFTFDFMHFTQTRIATIDVYITFFVLAMYFFMYCYCRKSFYDTPLSKTLLPLGACGVCMGCGIACKWTGIYAGAGLAVIFFAALYRRYGEYRYARAFPEGASNGIAHAHILEVFRSHAAKTLCFCLVFFVAVPALIYLLSYLPFQGYVREGLFARMLHNQTDMYRYHSTLDATHPYSSPWYEWPILKRPVWYYSSIVSGAYGSGGLREGISAFGNPLVWWAGIPASFYMLFLWIRKKDLTAAFLLTGYLAQYLPWFFVTRITFIYHYFPSVAFVALMLAHSLMQSKKKLSAQSFLALTVLYGTAAFVLFLLFYPVLSGQAVDAAFVDKWLRWFHSWVLTVP